MNEGWNKNLAHHAWWLSGLAVWVAFNVGMVGSSSFPRIFESRHALGGLTVLNLYFGTVVGVSSLVLLFVLKGTSPRRRGRLMAWSFVGAMWWGAILVIFWRVPGNHLSPVELPIHAFILFFHGLPFLWALATLFAALMWRPASSTKPERDPS